MNTPFDPSSHADQVAFATLTGGNTPLNSPGARQAYEAEILAMARRRLSDAANRTANLETRKQQWLDGTRTLANSGGFVAGTAEEEWVKANPQLLGSQGPRASGMPRENVVFAKDGYKTIFDQNGRAVGTDRPIADQPSLPSDATVREQQARGTAIGTAIADQFYGAPDPTGMTFGSPPASEQYHPDGEITSIFREGDRLMAARQAVEALKAKAAMKAAQGGAPATGKGSAELPADEATRSAQRQIEQLNAANAVAGSEQKGTDAERAALYQELASLRRQLALGGTMQYIPSPSGEGGLGDPNSDFLVPLTPEQTTQLAKRTLELEQMIRDNAAAAQAQAVATATPPDELVKYKKRMEAQKKKP